MVGTRSEGNTGDEQQELDVTPIDSNPTCGTVDEAVASPTPSSSPSPSPLGVPSKAQDGRAASELMNAEVTENVGSPASTNIVVPAAESGSNNMSPSTVQPAPASTKTIPLTPASTEVIEPASTSTKTMTTPQPAELIPGTCQAITGVENKENVALVALQMVPSPSTHIQTRSSNETVVLEQANVAMLSDESFTSLLAGISWDPNTNYGNLNDGIQNINHGNLGDSVWNNNQQLFNFDFLSGGMGRMKETGGQTTGGDLYLHDNMLMGQSMYSHLGPSQSNIPWDAAGVASAPKAAYNGSGQGVSPIIENPSANLDSIAQPVSVLIDPSIQQPKTSSQFPSPESTNQAAPIPSLEVTPPLATSAVFSDKHCPTTAQDNQPVTQKGRSRKPTKSREVHTLTEQSSKIPEWLSSAEDYLRAGVDAEVWKSCLDNWVIFEKEHGMLEQTSVSTKAYLLMHHH
jgi:hypothetical protein